MDTRIRGEELSKLKAEVEQLNAQIKARQPRTTGETLDKDAFLRLLTIQMSKQDPLSPMKNTEFVAQMAQFTALEQMKNINTSMTEVKQGLMVLPMFSMIGKEVSYFNETTESYVSGKAEAILLGKGGQPMMLVGGQRVAIEDIVSIRESSAVAAQQAARYEKQTNTQLAAEQTSAAPAAVPSQAAAAEHAIKK